MLQQLFGVVDLLICIYFFYRSVELKNHDKRYFEILIFSAYSYVAIVGLKAIFHIPLIKYPNTFALPSGHTYILTAYVAVFSFAVFKNSIPRYFVTVLFGVIEGARVVVMGYHSSTDAIMAVFFCLIQVIIFYEFLFKKCSFKQIILPIFILIPFEKIIISSIFPSYNIDPPLLFSLIYAILALALYISEKFFINKKATKKTIQQI